MVVRLSRTDREAIARRAVEHRFKAQCDALDAEGLDIAEAFYVNQLTFDQIRIIETAPDGWFEGVDYVRVGVGGMAHVVAFRVRKLISHCLDGYRSDWVGHPRLAPASWRACDHRFHLRDDNPLGKRICDHAERVAALWKNVRDAHNLTSSALCRFSTLEKLVRDWPEIEPFTHHMASKQSLVVATPILKVNQVLGLPVED